MTDNPETPRLSLQLRADEDYVLCDFADYDGTRLGQREKRALHGALDDAIANLNIRRRPDVTRRRDSLSR